MEIVMSTISAGPASSETFAASSWTARPVAVLKRWWIAYLTWRLEQTAIAQLEALSDCELKDIGLRRCEIQGSVKGWPKHSRASNRRS
jgi:uncharacterized protein YjiS (DUF1127 family)